MGRGPPPEGVIIARRPAHENGITAPLLQQTADWWCHTALSSVRNLSLRFGFLSEYFDRLLLYAITPCGDHSLCCD